MRQILSKKVSEVMGNSVVTLKPDDPVSKVKELFEKYDYNGIPIINESQILLGMVTKTDFLKFFTTGITSSDSRYFTSWANEVSEIMDESPHTVNPEATLIEAANLMVEYSLRTVPVTDKNNRLIGIITSTDISKYTIAEIERQK